MGYLPDPKITIIVGNKFIITKSVLFYVTEYSNYNKVVFIGILHYSTFHCFLFHTTNYVKIETEGCEVIVFHQLYELIQQKFSHNAHICLYST